MYRTHKCGISSKTLVGQYITVAGWVDGIRDHGGVKFIDLRDESGVLQLVATCDDQIKGVSRECVVSAYGVVKERSAECVNPKLLTGCLELKLENIKILGPCGPLPFEIENSEKVKEELRLKYRFLDLRNKRNHDIIWLRSEVLHFLRNKMRDLGFTEVQTPIISASSPEGARDYLIPSRKYKGKFYALPQAPQIFKQLLMVSNFDRYYQIAPCFRDEDSRADRAPGEFYQLDFEMAFAEQEDVFKVGEEILSELFAKFTDSRSITAVPFPRITFKESLDKYGVDKPDLRNPLEISDVSHVFKISNAPFSGQIVKVINVPGAASQGRKFFEKMNSFSIGIGMKGLGYVKVSSEMELSGPIEKFIPQEKRNDLLKITSPGSALFFISDSEKNVYKFSGQIRTELANQLGLIDNSKFAFCYITDFNMYEIDEKTGKVIFTHNPFSMPQGGISALSEKEPLDILSYQYDIVCNGIELSSGAVRNHDPRVMLKVFEIAGYSESDVLEKFPALYRAFSYGAPPHAGMAPGLDRIMMLITKCENIRDVVAFPMNAGAQDLLLGAPGYVSEEQLNELHIKIR
jgi:aspartyl-tRNA synthetase